MKFILSRSSIVHLIVRYILGVNMMAYGLIKILQVQFLLPDEVYNYRLGELDGVTLTWAFLGYSPWFASLIGVAELVPGFLLLFRKTNLLGAVLIFPSLFVVFLVNQAFGFLPHMRFLTSLLLFLDILLLSSSYQLLRRLLVDHLTPLANEKSEIILNGVIFGLLVFLIVYYLM